MATGPIRGNLTYWRGAWQSVANHCNDTAQPAAGTGTSSAAAAQVQAATATCDLTVRTDQDTERNRLTRFLSMSRPVVLRLFYACTDLSPLQRVSAPRWLAHIPRPELTCQPNRSTSELIGDKLSLSDHILSIRIDLGYCN